MLNFEEKGGARKGTGKEESAAPPRSFGITPSSKLEDVRIPVLLCVSTF
jgi:hypothetical protein